MTSLGPLEAEIVVQAEAQPARLLIGVLGGIHLSVAGAPLAITNRRARALLAYLALADQHSASREQLAGLLWGESGERRARNSLRQALFDLRGALDASGCQVLDGAREQVTLLPHLHTTDLDRSLTEIGRGEVPEALLAERGNAGALLAGYEDLSPGLRDWLATARQAAQGRLLRALEHGYANPAFSRRARRALAEAALRLDPLNEEACRSVMRLAAEDGETGIALRCYSALYALMGSELDMEPSAATQALVADIKRGVWDAQATPVVGQLAAPVAAPSPRRRIPTPGDTPMLAVLPFRPAGSDPLPAYLAEGIVEDIVCVLAERREPAVISANSTRRFKGVEAEDLAQVGAALGADYLVSGSVRVAGDRARITAELAEPTHGTVLWSGVFEAAHASLFEAQAQIAANVANTVVPWVNEVELRACRRRAPEDLGAYHLLLRARDLMFRLDQDALRESGELLQRAVALDPYYAPSYAALADWHSIRAFQDWSGNRAADVQALEEALRTAMRLDPSHARSAAMFGHNLTISARRYDEALAVLERAVATAPNDAETLCWTSPTLAYVGRAEEAVERAERALQLSPRDPFLFRYEHFLSLAHYAGDDLEAAAHWGQRSAMRNPNYTSNLRITVAALAGLGRQTEAAPLVKRLMTLQPALRVRQTLSTNAFRDSARRERHGDNLRKAGIPD